MRVGGFSPVEQSRAVRERIGFVMETSRLYPELRVRGFLRFMGGARGLAGAALARAVDTALARFHLEPVVSRLVAEGPTAEVLGGADPLSLFRAGEASA